ncbi:MAG: coenzyme F420-0:L-glutamate ligase / coenzyme F420:gamma-L-glutamate ligase [Actinomycetota bacterium]|nr:coenzyme F420-0:L-glutamate ligase / coenzyme F420:gamma-L-glutamate ligase [Actinomycetota bacterium]
MNEIRIIPIEGVPEVGAGDDLGELLFAALPEPLQERDVIVVTQKVVSKAEGRVIADSDRHQAALAESTRVLRRSGDMTISETRHGFVCANAGVDASNVAEGTVVLLPLDPDLSARRLRAQLQHRSGVELAVIVSDTFGRAWRRGQTDVAIGVAGVESFLDYRGTSDVFGRELSATQIAVVDELAGAAEMVMGKAETICAAIVRGARINFGTGSAAELVRPHKEDLFR